MSQKHRRKKQRIGSVEPPSKIVFTLPAVRMLKDALRLVEEALLRNTKPLPNRALAAETLEGLQKKLDDMLQWEEWDRKTPLDYNEIHMLCAAVHMYLIDITTSQDKTKLAECIALCQEFGHIMAEPPMSDRGVAIENE